ncbi:MAG: ABC transporter ATP-binding protein [Spirochaetes bacterium]|nr:ABC transporter ATP-binding protein [Spirochaetota bacterium]
MSAETLKVTNLKKYFYTKRGTVKAADGVSFSIQEKETLGLVGESGSGKSTVAYTIMGIYNPTQGNITFRDQDISKESKKRPKHFKKEIQIVFQDPGSSLNPRRSIKQILEHPLRVHHITGNGSLTEQVEKLLDMVGLPSDYMYKYPQAIGGGERQIIAIARALATNPSFIVLDEPTSALDVSVQAKIINLLMELQEELNLTYLFITHDLSLMRNMATRVAIMYLGKICEIAYTAEFFQNPMHPYTRMLLSSIPVVSKEEEELKPKKIISQGEIPSPVNIPTGCSFHLRCPEKMDICSKADPDTTELEKAHFVRCHLYPGA